MGGPISPKRPSVSIKKPLEEVRSGGSVESRSEKARKDLKNARVRQLTANLFIHKREIAKIERELETLLQDDISNITY